MCEITKLLTILPLVDIQTSVHFSIIFGCNVVLIVHLYILSTWWLKLWRTMNKYYGLYEWYGLCECMLMLVRCRRWWIKCKHFSPMLHRRRISYICFETNQLYQILSFTTTAIKYVSSVYETFRQFSGHDLKGLFPPGFHYFSKSNGSE